jgi:hypothetical protein
MLTFIVRIARNRANIGEVELNFLERCWPIDELVRRSRASVNALMPIEDLPDRGR